MINGEIESNISASEDKKWIEHKTAITDIKPLKYYEKACQKK